MVVTGDGDGGAAHGDKGARARGMEEAGFTRHRAGPMRQRNKPHKGGGGVSKREASRRAGGRDMGRARAGSAGAGSGHVSVGSGGPAGAKAHRKQAADAARKAKRDALVRERRALGVEEAPRTVVVVALAGAADAAALRRVIVKGKDESTEDDMDGVVVADGAPHSYETVVETHVGLGPSRAHNRVQLVVPRFQTSPERESHARDIVIEVLDAVRVADVVVFVLPLSSATGGLDAILSDSVDSLGRTLLSATKALGLPTVMGALQGLGNVPARHRSAARKHALEWFRVELGDACRVVEAEAGLEWSRALAEVRVRTVTWRAERAYALATEVRVGSSSSSASVAAAAATATAATADGTKQLVVGGYVRGHALRGSGLVHVCGFGTMQIERLRQVPPPGEQVGGGGAHRRRRLGRSGGSGAADAEMEDAPLDFEADAALLLPRVSELAEPDALAGEQTWPTMEELDAAEAKSRRRVGDDAHDDDHGDDDDDDDEEEEDEGREYLKAWGIESLEEEEREAAERRKQQRASGKAMDDVEAEDDPFADLGDDVDGDDARTTGSRFTFTNGLGGKKKGAGNGRSAKAEEAQMDLEFPDEVDTPEGIPARERFIKYRGLKSFRTSPWNPMESLPRAYAFLFRPKNYARLQRVVLEDAARAEAKWLENGTLPDDAVAPGSYVELTLRVPRELAGNALDELVAGFAAGRVVALGSLLPHEEKLSLVNVRVRPLELAPGADPVASRDSLEMHVGLWRRVVQPVLSEPNLNSDKFKMERFMEPGRWTMASAYAPLTFGVSVPALLFRPNTSDLVAVGTLESVDPNRIVLKKVVLTGAPFRIKRRWAVIRRMFYSPEDVAWFKPLEVYTKLGARGKILEPVGTHGKFKVLFDRGLNQSDTVCMDLYKRTFPRPVEGDELFGRLRAE